MSRMTRSFGFGKVRGRVEVFTVVNELCEYVDAEAAELDADAEERGAMDMRFIGNSGTAGGAAADCLPSARRWAKAALHRRRCIGFCGGEACGEKRPLGVLNLPAMACANLLTSHP